MSNLIRLPVLTNLDTFTQSSAKSFGMAKKNRINLSYVGENIKKIRQAKKLSQADFSKIFNLARASVGAYEEGRSEPKIEMLISMANYFGISIDALLTRKLTVNEIFNVNTLNEKLNRAHQLKGSPKRSDRTVRLVKADGYLDYVVHHPEKSFLDSLEETGFPSLNQRPNMAFEMNGTEMTVGNHGIKHGDILFGKEVDKKEVDTLINKVLVVITDRELVIRRLSRMESHILILSADDTQYTDKPIKIDTVFKVFEVVTVASQYIPVPDNTEDRLSRIEEELKKLKR